jgi:hypothetical protein
VGGESILRGVTARNHVSARTRGKTATAAEYYSNVMMTFARACTVALCHPSGRRLSFQLRAVALNIFLSISPHLGHASQEDQGHAHGFAEVLETLTDRNFSMNGLPRLQHPDSAGTVS